MKIAVYLIVGFIVGALIATGFLLGFQDWSQPLFSEKRLYEFLGWLGALIRDFTPWPIVLVALILFKPSRKYLEKVGEHLSTIISGISDGIKHSRRFSVAGFLEIVKNDPSQAAYALKEQVSSVEMYFKERVSEEAESRNLSEKLETLYREHIIPMIPEEKLDEDDVLPRITFHMRDPLYKNSVYQLLDYAPKSFYTESKVGRRFSTRHGIVGLAWRMKKASYDPEVSAAPKKLVEKWGMTEGEAAKAGKGRKSHLALPLPQGDKPPNFMLFLDAPAQHIFGDSVVGDEEEKVFAPIWDGLRQTCLDTELAELYEKFKDEKPIIDFRYGP
ncbi:hypothetical protein [Aquisalinus flavus]|uniref:Uncharacterized protein n=1 Tax=Aquisalinus flavus TaxID=1526572 RepID=A0A8J2V4U5_9PROT|nr:hypothetical protein [Aquisalinus flavus]MBD0427401.1 hypothetical protein [Aquisalinus flavus]UNE47204.1 sulfite exporter TauE/SafE family protein [Aquisalinus flavus]GGD00687.1 hypothetical protein GCM10011342_07150 [Aquisalinus flavus]